MKPRRPTLSRRLFLKGAGSVAIALPLLPELAPKARAEADGLPCRLFTMSFGLGIERALQLEQFDGALEPLGPFASKAAMFTRVNASALEGSGTPHFKAAAATFTGVPQNGESGGYRAGGPSLEQIMKRALHPDGVPNVSAPELSVGIWSRTGAVSQFTRHWNFDGSPGQRPERRPSRIFDILFGSIETGDAPADAEALRRRHLHRSVLDTVLDQYQSLTSARSPLGRASKDRISNHLSAIRDAERQLVPPLDGGDRPASCELPRAGAFSDPGGYAFYDAANGPAGSGAPRIDWQVADQAMRLIGELMAIGVSCDAVRFGSVVCVGGGGHIRFEGRYPALGQTLDFEQVLGDGTPHDRLFHAYNRDAVRLYQHFAITQLAHMLASMDALTETNGKTVLDNSLIVLGTEYGLNHDAKDCFHAVLGGGGRFNPGWYDQAVTPSDIYDQTLAAYGVDSGIRDRWRGYQPTEIAGFRAA